MGSGDITAAYLGFHGEPQDIWRVASVGRACYGGYILWVGPDVSSGCSASAEQVEGIWSRILLGSFICAFLFEKVPTLCPHWAVRESGLREP